MGSIETLLYTMNSYFLLWCARTLNVFIITSYWQFSWLLWKTNWVLLQRMCVWVCLCAHRFYDGETRSLATCKPCGDALEVKESLLTNCYMLIVIVISTFSCYGLSFQGLFHPFCFYKRGTWYLHCLSSVNVSDTFFIFNLVCTMSQLLESMGVLRILNQGTFVSEYWQDWVLIIVKIIKYRETICVSTHGNSGLV